MAPPKAQELGLILLLQNDQCKPSASEMGPLAAARVFEPHEQHMSKSSWGWALWAKTSFGLGFMSTHLNQFPVETHSQFDGFLP